MMNGVTLTISQKAGENDQFFGSVTSKDIADLLEKQGYNIDRRKIQLDEPIKTSASTRCRCGCIAMSRPKSPST